MNDNQSCSTSCGGSCGTCGIEEEQTCPVCGNVGFFVPFETVYSLTKDSVKDQLTNLQNDEFSICTHRACKVAYYSKNTRIFLKDIKVDLWFKHDKEKYMICYCRDISLNDVKEAVQKLDGEIKREEVIKFLGKEDKKSDCLHNNPTGMCCHRLFDNAIQYAIKNK